MVVVDLCSSSDEDRPVNHSGSQQSSGCSAISEHHSPPCKKQRTEAAQQGGSFNFDPTLNTVNPDPSQASASAAQPTSQSFEFNALSGHHSQASTAVMGRPQMRPTEDSAVCSAEKRLFGIMQQASQLPPSVTHVSDTVDNSGTAAPLTANVEEVSSPVLSDEQEEIMELVKQHKNVFFTGNAGTGKSFLLNHIIMMLKELYGHDFADSVAVCAATGIAATHIGGTTLHSSYGIGIPRNGDDFGKAWKEDNRKKLRAWRVLILDEISMVSGEMFEALERITSDIRGQASGPFGGLQLVLCGDYFQLPPIETQWNSTMDKDVFLNRGFTFQCPAWKRCKLEHRLLTKVFRQSDLTFVRILDAIRYNEDTPAALQELEQRCGRKLEAKAGVEPTNLFSRNADVNTVNEDRLQALPGDLVSLPATDKAELSMSEDNAAYGYHYQFLLKSEFFRDCLAPKDLKLKIGAQVMLLRNLDFSAGRMLVNGSRGVVIGFKARKEVDLEVAIEGSEAERQTWRQWTGQQLPVVRFLNGRELAVRPAEFTADVPGHGTCKRIQIPVKLAWAMTIHKCQGMTLDFANVSLRSVFAPGQAYVALSRARSMEGLRVQDLSPSVVKTSPLVKRFAECLKQGTEYQDNTWDNLMKLPPVRGSAPNAGSASSVLPSSSSAAAKCTHCGGLHASAGCPKQRADSTAGTSGSQPSSQPKTPAKSGFGGGNAGKTVCYKCQRPGHWAAQCPTAGPSTKKAYNSGNSSNAAQGRSGFASSRAGNGATGKCYKCGQPGHWANNCPRR